MDQNKAEEQLLEEIASFTHDPAGFLKYAYSWGKGELEGFSGPHEWQTEIANTIGAHLRSPSRYEPLRIAVSSGRGIGKSALISMLVDWGLSTCEDARIVVTANTGDQLATKTWPEIGKWFRRSINAHWWVTTATRICIIGKKNSDTWRVDRATWSENNIEAFRGLHNVGKRMIIVFDEAAGIPDPIWEATEGSLTDANTEMIWIAFSNPSRNSGRFSECFGKLKHRWVTRQIDSRTVPGTNREEIARWIEDYGEDDDYCRINVKGEFPRRGSTQFISGEVVTEARKRTVFPSGFKVLGVDVARFGDDQTVLGLRQGLKFTVLAKYRGLDTVDVSRRVMEAMRNEKPRLVVIDGDGLGAGVVDQVRHDARAWMAANKCHLREFHGGSVPSDSEMYFNLRAEVWGKMREWLKEGDIPNDPEIDRDLTGPEYFFSNKNQIQLEKKEDMKKRGVSSPDVADALAMTFSADPAPLDENEMSPEEASFLMRADKQFMEAF